MSIFLLALSILALAGALVLLYPRSVAGDWISPDEGGGPAARLSQSGPLVRGRRQVSGGEQYFEGRIIGRRLTLVRRDYGSHHISRMGFSGDLALELEGKVFARYSMVLSEDGQSLKGYLWSLKVYFHNRPSLVLKTEMIDRGEVGWERAGARS